MGQAKNVITINASPITIEQVLAIARGSSQVKLDDSPEFIASLNASVQLLDDLIAQGRTIYGVNTGFGASCETGVPTHLSTELAANLVRFHGCGTGQFLDETETAAVMIVRLISLCQGRSGVRPLLPELMCHLINNRILPRIPSEGSVGASGDLTPLSYIAAVLIGEREVTVNGVVMNTLDAMNQAGLKPIKLRPKEGLALMNGTSVMTGLACLAYDRARKIARWAAALTAMSSDVMRGNPEHFDDRLHAAKPHPGQRLCAKWIADDIHYESRKAKHDGRIQDRYSVRCAPHVIGVLLDALPFINTLLTTEINSSNDNPLLDVPTGEVLHGGNFYGGHPCLAMDILKIAVANVADLIDRQMALLCNPHTNNGLPADLVLRSSEDQASHHGFKAMQITASALTAEALKATMPASVFSRSTESHNQDKVSMGTIAARDALRIAELTETTLAVVQLALCQAVDLRKGHGCHTRSKQIHTAIRRHIPINDGDRRMDFDIAQVLKLLRENELPIGDLNAE